MNRHQRKKHHHYPAFLYLFPLSSLYSHLYSFILLLCSSLLRHLPKTIDPAQPKPRVWSCAMTTSRDTHTEAAAINAFGICEGHYGECASLVRFFSFYFFFLRQINASQVRISLAFREE
ncbi:hypothetical protein BDZ91DRAFT_715853 [Kalaharituber pfeilii]|nr:hypothetical protein BDZ91DRAFT_715853 [Kalaharituber pfeilii]